MSQLMYNLHNHTPFSDGAYTIDEIIQAHLDDPELNMGGIGICDHLFCTPSSREVTNEREFHRVFDRETQEYVTAQGQQMRKLYFFYTTCPKCAKHYGKNYVVAFAEV